MEIKKTDIVLVVVSLFFAASVLGSISDFKALPSPIFGGDYYYQQGAVEHILSGGNPLRSHSIEDGIPGYLPAYAICVALFATITGLGAQQGMLYFAAVLAFVIPIIWAKLLSNFVRNEWLAVAGGVLFALLILNPVGSLVVKYSEFTLCVMFPLFLMALYRAYKDFSWRNAAVLGFLYAILTLSHIVVFVGSTIALGLFCAYLALPYLRRLGELQGLAQQHWKAAAAFLLVASPIILAYWYEPLFVHHLSSPYDRTHMDVPDMSDGQVQIWFLGKSPIDMLMNFKSLETSLRSLLFLFVVYSIIKNRKELLDEPGRAFLLIMLLGFIVATYSYFVTEPLIGMNFIPTRMQLLIPPVLLLLGMHYIDRTRLMERHGDKALAFIVAIGIAALLVTMAAGERHEADAYFKNAGKPLPYYMLSLSSYIKENTSVNDVFLSTKELGFMMTSLSGRKLVTNRWAHQNDPYTDMPQRDIDAAIILYGDDDKAREELLEKYSVDYLYWDANWISTEFRQDPDGSIGTFDPLITLDDPEAREQLDGNGISYENMTTWIDPSQKDEHIRQYDILMVTPDNYRSIDRPWDMGLDAHLEEVWSYKQDGMEVAVLYKIR